VSQILLIKGVLNVPSGPHTIVNYTLVNVSTFSNLLEENFGSVVRQPHQVLLLIVLMINA
jgi:hypothetical protein